MKQIFAITLAVLSTLGMQAAINSQLTIYLDTETKEVEARIAGGDTYSPFDASASASYIPMYSNASNIGLYVMYKGGNYMELNAPELQNIPLVIVSSREAAAKQVFTLGAELGAAGNNSQTVSVTDFRPEGGGAPVTFELNNNTEYNFTLSNDPSYVEGTNSVIADRFVINFKRIADEGDIEMCFQFGMLQILNNPYLTNIVVKDENGVVKVDAESKNTPQEINLTALPAGQYSVEFNNGERKYYIVK